MITNILIAITGFICAPFLIFLNKRERYLFLMGEMITFILCELPTLFHVGMFIIGFVGGPLVLITLGSLLAAHIARGESDVNGDPERDAGILPTRTPSTHAPASSPSPALAGEGRGEGAVCSSSVPSAVNPSTNNA